LVYGTANSNLDQTVDQTRFNEFGDNTADVTGDQHEVNVAVPLALSISEEEEEETPTTPITPTPPEEEEPPEFAVFCFNSEFFARIICFDTMQDCNDALEFLVEFGGESAPNCTGFVTSPPGACHGEVFRNQLTGEVFGVSCTG
jgi:hypothetical protein